MNLRNRLGRRRWVWSGPG